MCLWGPALEDITALASLGERGGSSGVQGGDGDGVFDDIRGLQHTLPPTKRKPPSNIKKPPPAYPDPEPTEEAKEELDAIKKTEESHAKMKHKVKHADPGADSDNGGSGSGAGSGAAASSSGGGGGGGNAASSSGGGGAPPGSAAVAGSESHPHARYDLFVLPSDHTGQMPVQVDDHIVGYLRPIKDREGCRWGAA